jgi:hypothetical protein
MIDEVSAEGIHRGRNTSPELIFYGLSGLGFIISIKSNYIMYIQQQKIKWVKAWQAAALSLKNIKQNELQA